METRIWFITPEKEYSPEDLKNGLPGRCFRKSVLIECGESEIKETVNKNNRGWEIVSIQDWNELNNRIVNDTIEYILNT